MSDTSAASRYQFRLLVLCVVAVVLSGCGKKGAGTPPASGSPSASPVAEFSPTKGDPPKKLFETGEAVPAGYLGYKVISSHFSGSANASLLYIDLAIVNTDKKERPVAAMKLVDETGKEYSLSDKNDSKDTAVGKLGPIPPSQSKRAVAVFEAPREHEYKLKVPGFTAGDEVEIKLKPGAKPAK
jgi:predicted small lipoprotein YifL